MRVKTAVSSAFSRYLKSIAGGCCCWSRIRIVTHSTGTAKEREKKTTFRRHLSTIANYDYVMQHERCQQLRTPYTLSQYMKSKDLDTKRQMGPIYNGHTISIAALILWHFHHKNKVKFSPWPSTALAASRRRRTCVPAFFRMHTHTHTYSHDQQHTSGWDR